MFDKKKTFDKCYVRSTFENHLVWNIFKVALQKLGDIIFGNFLKPCLGLLTIIFLKKINWGDFHKVF